MKAKEQVLELLEHTKGDYISGSELAKQVGVSRNAIWKAIKSLQEEGYAIEAGTNKGYCLKQENDILSVQSISKYLPKELSAIRLEVYKTIDSTNTRIKEYATQGEAEGHDAGEWDGASIRRQAAESISAFCFVRSLLHRNRYF